MFFMLSKIVWALLSPLNFILVLLLAGALLSLTRLHRAGMTLIFGGIALFAAFGLLPLGPNLLAGLEAHDPAPRALPPAVTGIVILGGAFDTNLSAAIGLPVMNANAQRMMEGLRLARLYPRARLVFSGGEGQLAPRGHPEARDVADFIARYALDPGRPLIYEDRSRNTLENFAFTRDIVHPKPGERWIVVTSAYHMRRALEAARFAGWPSVIPWPTAYRTEGKVDWRPRSLDIAGNFYRTDLALHEYLGMIFYRLL